MSQARVESITSHHIASRRIASHYITSHHIIARHTSTSHMTQHTAHHDTAAHHTTSRTLGHALRWHAVPSNGAQQPHCPVSRSHTPRLLHSTLRCVVLCCVALCRVGKPRRMKAGLVGSSVSKWFEGRGVRRRVEDRRRVEWRIGGV